ncbi:unnamed protein product [Brassica rapa subsp. narinosa]
MKNEGKNKLIDETEQMTKHVREPNVGVLKIDDHLMASIHATDELKALRETLPGTIVQMVNTTGSYKTCGVLSERDK